MWCGLLLVGFLANGAQAFRPAPLRWGGRLGKKLFLTPTVPLDGIAAPQRLTLKESSDSKVPYFTANQDHTISCDDNDLRWCLEASVAERGHVVRVNHCTSRPAQKWRWLPWGLIQLEGTDQCIFVDENDGLTTASVQLGECVNKATDTWMFEDTAPALAWSSSHKFPFANFSIGAAVMVSTLGLGAWMWRRQKESGMLLASKGSVPLTMHQSGVCLAEPSAVRSNEIAMKLRRSYTRGYDDGSPVDETAIDKLLADRDLARRERRFNDADAIRDDLHTMGVFIWDRDQMWTVGNRKSGNSNRGREPKAGRTDHSRGRSASGYKRGFDNGSVVDEMAVEDLLTEREQRRKDGQFREADQIRDKLHSMGVTVSDRDREWTVGRYDSDENNFYRSMQRRAGHYSGDGATGASGPDRSRSVERGPASDMQPGTRKLNEWGHDYARAEGDSASLNESTIRSVNNLLRERLEAKFSRDFESADSLLAELERDYGVTVNDGTKAWRADGKTFERTFKREGPASGVDEQRVMEMITERRAARKARNYRRADQILSELLDYHGVVVVDSEYTWRFVGDRHDGGYAEGGTYGRRSDKFSTPTDGHDYARDWDDGSPLEASDLQAIDELLATRLSKKKNHKFAEADALQEELYARFGVEVYDRERIWSCRTSKPRDLSQGYQAAPTDGRDYVKDMDDRSPLEASDLQANDELLATRLSEKKNDKFAEADALQEEMYASAGLSDSLHGVNLEASHNDNVAFDETVNELVVDKDLQIDKATEPTRSAEGQLDRQSQTVVQLKAELRSRGLPVSGKKAELIRRLEEAA